MTVRAEEEEEEEEEEETKSSRRRAGREKPSHQALEREKLLKNFFE